MNEEYVQQIKEASDKLAQQSQKIDELLALSEMLEQYLNASNDTSTAQNSHSADGSANINYAYEQASKKLYNAYQVANIMHHLAWQADDIQAWLTAFIEDFVEASK